MNLFRVNDISNKFFGGMPMNVVPDTQLAAAVNNELASMQLPATNQVVTYIMNSIAPYINNMAAQANFAYNAYESMVHSLMMQNQQQIMEIARLRQTHQEMPRMFCTNPANGTSLKCSC